ncbi:hypothetical protein NRB20_60240 [Nocardia sp. RB20]|uniref:Uncharacterized protein n=2 Tax=Nocardia macrotermitis TaxID=2585198 RepID=A0A7K0DAU3_9NOCA|nr:hypothetical protein [Nocardia macrotermitis]
MIVDRIAQYTAEAHGALADNIAEPHRHLLWLRLAELACAYSDLAFEVGTGRRRLPTLTYLPGGKETWSPI